MFRDLPFWSFLIDKISILNGHVRHAETSEPAFWNSLIWTTPRQFGNSVKIQVQHHLRIYIIYCKPILIIHHINLYIYACMHAYIPTYLSTYHLPTYLRTYVMPMIIFTIVFHTIFFQFLWNLQFRGCILDKWPFPRKRVARRSQCRGRWAPQWLGHPGSVSIVMGVPPIARWLTMENPGNMDDLGVHPF